MASDDGSLSVEVNLGGRVFRPVVQDPLRAMPVDVLVADLDRNGFVDLYLVCDGPNASLWGDGMPDLLLHNASSDVLFWARHDGLYDRDPQGSGPCASARL